MQWLWVLWTYKFLNFQYLLDIVCWLKCLVERCIWLRLSEKLRLLFWQHIATSICICGLQIYSENQRIFILFRWRCRFNLRPFKLYNSLVLHLSNCSSVYCCVWWQNVDFAYNWLYSVSLRLWKHRFFC